MECNKEAVGDFEIDLLKDVPHLPGVAHLFQAISKSSDEYDMFERLPIHPMTKEVEYDKKSSDKFKAFPDLPSFEYLVSLAAVKSLYK